MKIFSFLNLRSWLHKANSQMRTDINGLDDVYVTKVIESLNYCKSHPDSTECENMLIQP